MWEAKVLGRPLLFSRAESSRSFFQTDVFVLKRASRNSSQVFFSPPAQLASKRLRSDVDKSAEGEAAADEEDTRAQPPPEKLPSARASLPGSIRTSSPLPASERRELFCLSTSFDGTPGARRRNTREGRAAPGRPSGFSAG